MSFEVNDQKVSTTLFTGYAVVKVSSFKIEAKDDKQMLTFYVETKDGKISAPLVFFLEPKINESRTGKTQYIDEKGRTQYFEGNPQSTEYFDANTARPAIRGEEDVTKFLIALGNVRKNQNARFDNFETIAKGDITQIQNILKIISNNNVGVLLGVNGTYQRVHNRVFAAGWRTDAGTQFEKTVNNETSTSTFYGVPPFKLTEYDINSIQPDAEPQSDKSFNPSMPEFNFAQPNSIAEIFPDSIIEPRKDVFSEAKTEEAPF